MDLFEGGDEGFFVVVAIAIPTARLTQERVEELLLEGLASGESIDMTPSDWDDLRQIVQDASEAE